MKILYICGNCSRTKYEELFKNSSTLVLQQAQKYHSLLLEGLRDNDIAVTCFSGLPINRSIIRNYLIPSQDEEVDNIHYHYYASINLPVLRQISLFLGAFFNVFFFRDPCKKISIICDFLNVSNASGALLAAKIRNMTTVSIVTDIPGFMADDSTVVHPFRKLKQELFNKFYQFILLRFDAYVCLTDFMNEKINKQHKPYIVMEGHVDINMAMTENLLQQKHHPKIVLYAGLLKKIYGIETLVQAFNGLQNDDTEFHIYGDGEYTTELLQICNQNPRIRYHGVKPNKFIIEEEIRATLLVNPRPTAPSYTKYSFPSKNMEYMASGTPLLTTKLPGMPLEYLDHVYLIEQETSYGLTRNLQELLAKPAAELHAKGSKAKKFVLKEKNNVVQSSKIIDMIRSITSSSAHTNPT